MSFLKTLQNSSRYRLDDKIATGGYGEVWRATDVLLGRTVAVKQLPPDRARSEQTLIRFRAEAQRAGSLGHENITRVYDYVEPGPTRSAVPGHGAGRRAVGGAGAGLRRTAPGPGHERRDRGRGWPGGRPRGRVRAPGHQRPTCC